MFHKTASCKPIQCILFVWPMAIFISLSLAAQTTTDPDRSARQVLTIDNAQKNQSEDLNSHTLEIPGCSDTAAIARYSSEQKIKFNDAYFDQFRHAQLDLRARLNEMTKGLYDTFAFVGRHAGNFGDTTKKSLSELQALEAAAEQDLVQKIDAKNKAGLALKICEAKPTIDPACTSEKQALTLAEQEVIQSQTKLDQITYELEVAQKLANNMPADGTASDQPVNQAQADIDAARELVLKTQGEMELAKRELDAAYSKCNQFEADCYDVQIAQENYQAKRAAYYEARAQVERAVAVYEKTALQGAAITNKARANQASSDQVAGNIETLYKTYINSIDDYISEAKRVEQEALAQYNESLLLQKDNSDYDIFNAIMSDFSTEADKVINSKIMVKNMAMTATASSAVQHLACKEIDAISGMEGTTGVDGKSPAVEVTSLRLFRAASAMYLASQINSASTYNNAIKSCILKCEALVNVHTYDASKSVKEQIVNHMGVYRSPECTHKDPLFTQDFPGYFVNDRNPSEDKDEQIAAVERAANTYQKLVDTTMLKRATMEDALNMYQKAWEVSLEEWRDKLQRVSTAQSELDQARAMLSSTKMNINLISLALTVARKIMTGCCGSGSSCCGSAKSRVDYLISVLLALNKDKAEYENRVAQWSSELKRSQTHAHLDCNFPKYDTNYTRWDRSKKVNTVMDIKKLGEVAYSPIKQEVSPGSLFDTVNRFLVQSKAPQCLAQDFALAKEYAQIGGKHFLNFLFPTATAQTGISDSDRDSGDALGIRGKEDIPDKTQTATVTDTSIFEIFLAQKLSALKIQTYDPSTDKLIDLRENPASVAKLAPQNVDDLGSYLYRLVANGKINKSNAMSFAPTSSQDMPTNTGFPLPETRHFYIQSVLFQLQDLITELSMALGRNCGTITADSSTAKLNENPDFTDLSGKTSSSLCAQRDYYVTLLKQMKTKMNLGVTGMDDDQIKLETVSGGSCMKQAANGQFQLDRECACISNSSCAKFSYPQFAKFDTSLASASKRVIDGTNALLSGNTSKASLAAADLSKSSSATRKRAKELSSKFSDTQQTLAKNNKKKQSTTDRLASGFSASLNKVKSFMGLQSQSSSNPFSSNYSADAPATVSAKQSSQSAAGGQKSDGLNLQSKINENNNNHGNAGASAYGNSGQIDLTFGDASKIEIENLEDSQRALVQLNEQEANNQNEIYDSFQNTKNNRSRSRHPASTINSNSHLSLFKIISKRYKETAFPIFMQRQ